MRRRASHCPPAGTRRRAACRGRRASVVNDPMRYVAQISTLIAFAALVVASVTLAGCGGSKSTPTVTSAIAPRDPWGTVWLCRPGEAGDPCVSNLATTVVTGRGATHIERASPAKNPPIDCFYVYPTVSGQPTINANRAIGFREREIAIAQVSRFSQVCRVYAPVYRQITLSALAHPSRITLAHALIAYRDVLDAFRDYLAHYNHGRGIVFIGHSQGATILIRLLQQEVDRRPAVRRLLVSALLLGGNVTVPKGRTVGGDFAHLPACTASRQAGCVIAYSSFTRKPPKNSQFGRTTSDAGVILMAPHNPSPNLRIMCVNPASPEGGSAPLDPYIPALVLAFLPAGSALSVKTPWVAFRGEYTARCESSGNATWLQITHVAGIDKHPLLSHLRDPALGLHALDVNVALGNLVHLVGEESAAYRG
jgi:Protein of unknown function (DUF3089)